MIHIRHTSSAELARRRIRLLVCCLPLVLAPCVCLVLWAMNQSELVFCGDRVCNFQGVVFEALPAAKARQKQVTPHQMPLEIESPQLLVQALPEAGIPEFDAPELPQEKLEDGDETPPHHLCSIEPGSPKPAETSTPASAMVQNPRPEYTAPAYLDCPQPSYPPRLLQRRVEGSVGVRIAVAADGIPHAVEITESSGNSQLDRHVRNWILQYWKFTPARKLGQPVAAMVQTQVNFNLQA